MKQSSVEELPLRCRGVSLRILRDRIDAYVSAFVCDVFIVDLCPSVLNENELDMLRSQIHKVDGALKRERQKTFQLEQQLTQLSQKEDEESTTRTQLIHVKAPSSLLYPISYGIE